MSKSSSLNIREFINQHALSRNQWVLIALCFCIVAVDGMDVAIMGFVAPSIIAEWGISRPAFGAVMGAAPIGLAIGALVAGSSSDWWGRRKVLLGSVLFFGLCTLCTAHASNVTEMALWRLLTGLGLGAAMPNATTLLSEYVPEHRRSFLVAAMFTGFNLGSGVVGFIAAGLIPHWGWQSVLYVGGALPLLMLPLLYLYLPESARFMVTRGMSADRIAKVLGRVTQVPMADIQRFESGEPAVAARQPIAVLFSQGFKLRTLTLWSTYFMGLLVIYLTTSWLPTMMKDAGMSVDRAATVTAMFQVGGTVGALLVGWLMDRFNANRIIAVGYALTAVSIWWIGQEAGNLGWLVVSVFVAGTIMNTAQSSMPALAAAYYPTSGRATGVAWMLGIGRFGGIAGSFLVAELTVRNLGFSQIFTVVAIPGLIAAAALIIKQMASPKSER